ncbi:MAG: hypothetical protein K2L29_02490 [Duncaniella sp.]|nr:hypothetical protein [Duncaniella sp.]MDE6765405.1 hypothetical protein [Duncaniella sp.]
MRKLPVSKKVYSDISERIRLSLGHMPESAAEAMRLVDAYLYGGPAESQDAMAMIAFNMVRVELDRAMARSLRARERAARRKASGEGNTGRNARRDFVNDLLKSMGFSGEDYDSSLSAEPEKPSRRLTRAERRAAARVRKGRWKALS